MRQYHAILFKDISEQVLFIMSILNPFYKLKYPSFSPTTLLYSFLNAQTSSNTFQRHFRTSSFLSDRPKPILQIEVPILFTQNFTLQLFECSNTKQYFSKGISEQALFLMSFLNPFYKLKYPSFTANTKQYFSKGISQQVPFLMSLLNPFYKLKYSSFSPQLYFTTFFLNVPPKPILQVEVPNFFTQNYTSQLFECPQHQAILFKRYFRTSYFLNVLPKPILQVEVPNLFTRNYTLQLFECHIIKQYFSKTFQNKFFS